MEGAVIVASILLAFAIEAAWSARNDGLRRDALFAALAREMELASIERQRVAGYHVGGRDAVGALLSLEIPEAAPPEAAQLVDSLLQMAYNNTATFDAPLGALNGLLMSGNLDLVEDGDLLLELTSHPRLVTNLNREQEFLTDVGFRLLEYLGAAGVDVSRLNGGAPDEEFAVPWQVGPTVAHTLVGEPHFRSLLNELWWRYRNSVQSLEDMRESIERIRVLSDRARSR